MTFSYIVALVLFILMSGPVFVMTMLLMWKMCEDTYDFLSETKWHRVGVIYLLWFVPGVYLFG